MLTWWGHMMQGCHYADHLTGGVQEGSPSACLTCKLGSRPGLGPLPQIPSSFRLLLVLTQSAFGCTECFWLVR